MKQKEVTVIVRAIQLEITCRLSNGVVCSDYLVVDVCMQVIIVMNTLTLSVSGHENS